MKKLKRFFAYCCGLGFVGLGVWVIRNFGTVTIDQVIFHLAFGGESLLSVDRELVESFLTAVVWIPTLASMILILFESIMSRMLGYFGDGRVDQINVSKKSKVKRFTGTLVNWRGTVVMIAGVGLFLDSVSTFRFVMQENAAQDYFVERYVHPEKVRITPTAPKNLVLIYVESLEASYSDREKFGSDLIGKLTVLEGQSFERFIQVPGAGWTMAGIVASQCGLPLKNIFGGFDQGDDVARSHHFNKMGKRMQTFLPNATCLGDILKSHGYQSVFIGGASGSFAGKAAFFGTHHYDEYFGKEELALAGLGQQEGAGWGYLDDQTLNFARTLVKRLHESRQPFNLTILTLDTHGPDGLYSANCRQRGAEDYRGILTCNAGQIADFIDYMRRQGYLKDTNVFIMGDHLSMKTPLSDQLPKEERFIYNKMISNEKFVLNRGEICHFDIFPTLLEFAGFEIEGDRLGFGYSAINNSSVVIPSGLVEEFKQNVLNHSDTYLKFWRAH